MSYLEQSGSFIREPEVSEAALQRCIEALGSVLRPDENTVIERTLSTDSVDPEKKKMHQRAQKEINAAIRHSTNGAVAVNFEYNPGARTLQPTQLKFGLIGTEDLVAVASYDVDEHVYHSWLGDNNDDIDSDDNIMTRSDIQPSTISTLLDSVSVNDIADLSSPATYQSWLSNNMRPDRGIKVTQKQTLSEEESSSELASGETITVRSRCEIKVIQDINPETVLNIIELSEIIEVDQQVYSRKITLTISEMGEFITLREGSDDEKVPLTYELLERSLQTVKKFQKLATAE